MRVGMTVNVPKTNADRVNLRKLVLLLDEAAVHAALAGLYIQAVPGAEFIGAITESLMETWRATNGDLST